MVPFSTVVLVGDIAHIDFQHHDRGSDSRRKKEEREEEDGRKWFKASCQGIEARR